MVLSFYNKPIVQECNRMKPVGYTTDQTYSLYIMFIKSSIDLILILILTNHNLLARLVFPNIITFHQFIACIKSNVADCQQHNTDWVGVSSGINTQLLGQSIELNVKKIKLNTIKD